MRRNTFQDRENLWKNTLFAHLRPIIQSNFEDLYYDEDIDLSADKPLFKAFQSLCTTNPTNIDQFITQQSKLLSKDELDALKIFSSMIINPSEDKWASPLIKRITSTSLNNADLAELQYFIQYAITEILKAKINSSPGAKQDKSHQAWIEKAKDYLTNQYNQIPRAGLSMPLPSGVSDNQGKCLLLSVMVLMTTAIPLYRLSSILLDSENKNSKMTVLQLMFIPFCVALVSLTFIGSMLRKHEMNVLGEALKGTLQSSLYTRNKLSWNPDRLFKEEYDPEKASIYNEDKSGVKFGKTR